MPLYTFYPCLPGGNSLSFEAYELADDEAATAHAEVVLDNHIQCTHVVVWNGAREVGLHRRAPDMPHESPSPEARFGT